MEGWGYLFAFSIDLMAQNSRFLVLKRIGYIYRLLHRVPGSNSFGYLNCFLVYARTRIKFLSKASAETDQVSSMILKSVILEEKV